MLSGCFGLRRSGQLVSLPADDCRRSHTLVEKGDYGMCIVGISVFVVQMKSFVVCDYVGPRWAKPALLVPRELEMSQH